MTRAGQPEFILGTRNKAAVGGVYRMSLPSAPIERPRLGEIRSSRGRAPRGLQPKHRSPSATGRAVPTGEQR